MIQDMKKPEPLRYGGTVREMRTAFDEQIKNGKSLEEIIDLLVPALADWERRAFVVGAAAWACHLRSQAIETVFSKARQAAEDEGFL